jgi:predicted kinase
MSQAASGIKMKIGTLIIFSGLPGSGKSTLAAKLASTIGAAYVRIDTIEQGLRDICQISQMDGKGYELAHRISQENLRVGNMVIADSVNPWGLTRKAWNNVAEEVGANFINIEVVCSDKEEHRRRVESRGPSVPGLKVPTWEEILKRDYHPWSEEHHVLDTSGKNIEQSFEELLSVVRGARIIHEK